MEPRSAGLRGTGIGFTIGGTALGMLGTALVFDRDSVAFGAAFMALGGTTLMMGIPMWFLGAQEIPAGTKPKSLSTLITGVVMTSAGLGTMGMATAVLIDSGEASVLSMIPMALGAGMVIGGVAAGVYGLTTVPIQNASLRVGPTSIDVSYNF